MTLNRRDFGLGAAALTLAAGQAGATAKVKVPPAIVAAVNGAARTQSNRIRDPWRHPAETLAFWGLKPGLTVVEIAPAGGYWTEILAPYLKANHGHYIAAQGGDVAKFKARYADPAVWGDVRVTPFEADSGPLGRAGSADMVITSRNIHDWMWTPGRLDKALKDFHAVLKRGGVLAVEEHRADPRPMAFEARDGYVATAWLTAAVEKAGFRLQGASEINANPKDTKDHPFGVWTLPPTRRTHEKDKPTPDGFNPAVYDTIGESDRMTLRFRKV